LLSGRPKAADVADGFVSKCRVADQPLRFIKFNSLKFKSHSLPEIFLFGGLLRGSSELAGCSSSIGMWALDSEAAPNLVKDRDGMVWKA
jgi:hypothetical protein